MEIKSTKSNLMLSTTTSLTPPWEALVLVAHHLDSRTLALASGVSKLWHVCMSSDHIWQPICTSHYPSLSRLKLSDPLLPYNRIYAIAYYAAKRPFRSLSKPHLSLDDLIFEISIVGTKNNDLIIHLSKSSNEIFQDNGGLFRFHIAVVCECMRHDHEILSPEHLKISWNVALRGWKSVFSMMDCEGKFRFEAGSEGWFSEELPSTGCCLSNAMSGVVGLVADLKLWFCISNSKGRTTTTTSVRVENVSVGMLSTANWRYVSVDDGLRYLQHFI